MEINLPIKIKPAIIRCMLMITVILLVGCQPAKTQADAQTTRQQPSTSPRATSNSPTSTPTSPQPTEEISTKTEPLDNAVEVPFYARYAFILGEYLHNDEWAVIYFYRPPDCVPVWLNLLESQNPQDVYECGPVTISGAITWKNGAALDKIPLESHLIGSGSVPLWFVPWPALEIAVEDGSLKMFELKQLPLLKGTANIFEETQIQEPCCKLEITASGMLQDGGMFTIDSHSIQIDGATPVSKTNINLPDSLTLYPEPEALWGSWSNKQLVLEVFDDSSLTVYLFGSVEQDGRRGHKFYQGKIVYEDGIMTWGGSANKLAINSQDPCPSRKDKKYFVLKMPGDNTRLRFIPLRDDCSASKKDFTKPFEPYVIPAP